MLSKEYNEFFELLQYSEYLKKNNKNFQLEDSTKYNKFLKYQAKIEVRFHAQNCLNYIKLFNNFLDGTISSNEFSYLLVKEFYSISQQVRKIESTSIELKNFPLDFIFNSELDKLIYNSINDLFWICEGFDSDPDINDSPYNETELKIIVKEYLDQFKKICN